ncbi:MAG: anti-sigma factor [Bryobacteraceae bacterium]|jgi:hypothetical protein
MSGFEDELREALRREEPPEGFVGRVMARIQSREQAADGPETSGPWGRLSAAFRAPRLRWATACAAVALLVGGLEYRAQRMERAEGERARRQVMLALRITGSKLRLAQARVRRMVDAPVER